MKKTYIIVLLLFLSSCSEHGGTHYKEGKYKKISVEDNYPELVIKAIKFEEGDHNKSYALLKKQGRKVSAIINYKNGEKLEELRFYYNVCGYLMMSSSMNYETSEYYVVVTENSGGDKYFISPIKLSNLDADRILHERLSQCRK